MSTRKPRATSQEAHATTEESPQAEQRDKVRQAEIGRMVHYYVPGGYGKPFAAIITGVSDKGTNLAFFTHSGEHRAAINVPFNDKGEYGWRWPDRID